LATHWIGRHLLLSHLLRDLGSRYKKSVSRRILKS
jgi:hypothetical protein